MSKQPINQTTLSRPMLPPALFEPPPVEAIAITTQEKIGNAQANDPVIYKIVEAPQMGNAAR
uniref:Uncharacterized protein n=1 Tax=Romanomermis culicivorax TaxID=13658 RepID=A0A915HV60_ROMCU